MKLMNRQDRGVLRTKRGVADVGLSYPSNAPPRYTHLKLVWKHVSGLDRVEMQIGYHGFVCYLAFQYLHVRDEATQHN